MPLLFIPFLLLIVPILEIAVFILIGREIGLWPTLGLILVTAIIGTLLLRLQGFQLLQEIRLKSEKGELPGRALVHGVMLLIAGVLLLTPGFVTDTIGFSLFVPPIRDAIWAFFKNRVAFNVLHPDPGQTKKSDAPKSPIIDLKESEFGPADPNSPWKEK